VNVDGFTFDLKLNKIWPMKTNTIPMARIFVCINEKAPEKAQCLKGEGERILVWLKDEVARLGLKSKIWVTRTKCQGYCDPKGTVVTIQTPNATSPTHTIDQFSDVVFDEAPGLLAKLVDQISN
jgi:predicted metal-binding protein